MNFSSIKDIKLKILKYGVYFEPYGLFSNYDDIKKYKTKKIKLDPKRFDGEVYDVSSDKNILPAEIIISADGKRSIVKLRYNPDSILRLELQDNKLLLYENGQKLSEEISLVKKYEILNEKTPIIINGCETRIKDFVDIVGIDRISILFFEGCYNWTCGKACKFCDLHPKEMSENVIRPTINTLKNFNGNIKRWWDSTKEDYFKGIEYSLTKILENIDFPHKHLYFMAGNLSTNFDVWNIAEETIANISNYLDISEFDSYLNIAPHDQIDRLKKIYQLGIKQVQYNLEVANKELFTDICPGKMEYDCFVDKLKEAVEVFGFGNVRSNFVFGLQEANEMIVELKRLASFGIVPDYSVFQPKRNTPFQDRKVPDFEEVIYFSTELIKIYKDYNFRPIFCSLSSRSSIINELYEDES